MSETNDWEAMKGWLESVADRCDPPPHPDSKSVAEIIAGSDDETPREEIERRLQIEKELPNNKDKTRWFHLVLEQNDEGHTILLADIPSERSPYCMIEIETRFYDSTNRVGIGSVENLHNLRQLVHSLAVTANNGTCPEKYEAAIV